MARQKKARYLLEKNKIITVQCYHDNKFEKNDEKVFKCSNCSNSIDYKQVYELVDVTIIGLCFHCTKKVHNLTTSNPKFRKY